METINLVALGGPCSGKTSVLSLMEVAFSQIPSVCKELLLEKQETTPLESDVDIQPSVAPKSFDAFYTVTLKKKHIGYNLRMVEAPDDGYNGENPVFYNTLCSLVEKSQIILITADIPRLMAHTHGEHDYNHIHQIARIVQHALERTEDRRLIMIVPTKCECYYDRDEMKAVNRAVQDSYSELIQFLKDEQKANHTLAIVPVLTLGTSSFSHFDENNNAVFEKTGSGVHPIFHDHPAMLTIQFLLARALFYKKNPREAKKRYNGSFVSKVSADSVTDAMREIGSVLDVHDSVAYEILFDSVGLNVRRKLADFNILMFGPRRAGKTSIMASMISCFEKVSTDLEGRIKLEATEETKELLSSKALELQETFQDGRTDGLYWTIPENPTDNAYEFEFEMRIPESRRSYTLNFMDIPGEWLQDPERTARIKKELNNCQIVIIAIDTPHMMEDGAKYHDSFNRCNDIAMRLKGIKDNLDRLVLFVPVKCEKYYYENRMQEVQNSIKEGIAKNGKAYANLLRELAKGKKKKQYTVAITPILTMGGVVFDSFQKDAKGQVIRFTLGRWIGRPKAAHYKLYDPAPYFAPKYCEQPVLYLLCFILRTAKIAGKTSEEKFKDAMLAIGETILFFLGSQKSLKEVWQNVFTDTKLLESAEIARTYLKTEGDGYELLQNSL